MTNEPQNPQDASASESVTSSVSVSTGAENQNPGQGQTVTRDTVVKDGKVVKDETRES